MEGWRLLFLSSMQIPLDFYDDKIHEENKSDNPIFTENLKPTIQSQFAHLVLFLFGQDFLGVYKL